MSLDLERALKLGLSFDVVNIPPEAAYGHGLEDLKPHVIRLVGQSSLEVINVASGLAHTGYNSVGDVDFIASSDISFTVGGVYNNNATIVLGELTKPGQEIDDIALRIGIHEGFLSENKKMANNVKKLAAFALAIANIVIIDEKFSTEFGNIEKDDFGQARLVITKMLMRSTLLLKKPLFLEQKDRENWRDFAAKLS